METKFHFKDKENNECNIYGEVHYGHKVREKICGG